MLETERLRLRQWKDEDYPAYARLNADPMVMRYFPSALSVQESHEQADKLRSLITERGWGHPITHKFQHASIAALHMKR